MIWTEYSICSLKLILQRIFMGIKKNEMLGAECIILLNNKFNEKSEDHKY